MVDIQTLIKQLETLRSDWKEYLKKCENLDKLPQGELKEAIYRLIIILKEECKRNEGKVSPEFISQYIDDNDVAKILSQQVNTTLIYYHIFTPIRQLCNTDKDSVTELIENCFNHFILRFDPDMLKKCDATRQEIMKALDTLTDYYIKRLYTKSAVVKDMEDETGLPWDICLVYAELYEKNFHELKTNVLMNELIVVQNYIQKMDEN